MLDFLLLGPVEMRRDGRLVALRGTRNRAVLAALLLAGERACSIEQLTEVLYDDPPRTAVAQVHIVVSRLRALLAGGGAEHGDRGDEAELLTARPGYRLRLGAARLDLAEFRRGVGAGDRAAGDGDWAGAWSAYATALGLWRGPACHGVGSAALAADLAGLERERDLAAVRQAAAGLLAGRYDDATRAAVDALARQPMSERLHQIVVLGHALAGRTGPALAAYRGARTLLADELGVDPGHALAQAELDVLDGEPARSLAAVRDWFPAPAGAPVCQLPAGVAGFVGRQRELDRIAGILDKAGDTPPVACLYGMAGVGKTALVLRAARAALPRFPDGCVYVELRADREPYEVLGSVLRSLGVAADAVPTEPDARLALYRSTTAGRRLLVVADGAWEERQVRPLVPGSATAAVLVTSRRPLLALDNATAVPVPVVSVDEALDLLAAAVGPTAVRDDPAGARRLVELCDRLPLALRLAAARLSGRGPDGLAWMAQRMADEHRRLDELSAGDRAVRSSLAASYRRLPDAAARVLRLLATLPPVSVPVWLVSAALDRSDGDPRRLLELLVELQFVQETGDDRYQMHDLVRLFAAECPAEAAGERDRWRRRAYGRLLARAAGADARLPSRRFPLPRMPASDDGGDPTGFFDTEWDLLTAAIAQATSLGWAGYAWRLAACGINAAGLDVRAGEWRHVLGQVLELLGAHRHPAGAAALLLGDGMLLREQDDHRGAMRRARRARLWYRRAGDEVRAATAASELGLSARITGGARVAAAALGWAVQRFDRVGSPPQAGWAHLGQANLAAEHSTDPAVALREYGRAAAVFTAAGDRRGLATTLGSRGVLLMRRQQLAEGSAALRNSRALLGEIGDRLNHGVAGFQLANAYRRVGRLDEAYELASDAVAELAELRQEMCLARARSIRAAVLVDLGRAGESVADLQESLAVFRRLGVPKAAAAALFDLARALAAVGDIERSHRHAVAAQQLFERQADVSGADVSGAEAARFVAELRAANPAKFRAANPAELLGADPAKLRGGDPAELRAADPAGAHDAERRIT